MKVWWVLAYDNYYPTSWNVHSSYETKVEANLAAEELIKDGEHIGFRFYPKFDKVEVMNISEYL